MKIKHLTPKDYQVANWSGGKTTQIYIYPEEALYSKRNFLFRLSSATVEEEYSTFTKLEKVERELILLEGEMRLIHKGRGEKQLKPYDKHRFSGEWETVSYGKATDFNLMIKAPMKGEMHVISIEEKQESHLIQEDNSFMKGFYCAKGHVEIRINGASYLVSEHELILIERENQDEVLEIQVKGQENQTAKVIEIQLTKGV